MSNLRILVIDDDPVVLQSCIRILIAEGHAVTTSSAVKEALGLLAENDYQLVLVDVIMPEFDGLYFLEKMRQQWPDLPVVAMSGYPTPDTISAGRLKGATHFIAKPFTPEELLDAVATGFKVNKE